MTAGEGCLGILHLIKGGGSAVREVVEQFSGSYTTPLYFDRQQFCSDRLLDGVSPGVIASLVDADTYRDVVRTHRVVMGHVSSATLVDAGCRSLAIQVREPRSRLLSLYRYWQGQDQAQLAGWGRWGRTVVVTARSSVWEFLTSGSTWPATDNALTRQALGGLATPYDEPKSWTPQPDDFELFGDLLDIADWSNHSDQFVRRVAAHLGQPPPPQLQRVNVTEVTGGCQVIDQPSLEMLDRLTVLDRTFLSYLVDNSMLSERSQGSLDLEFEHTAARLGFTFG